jgi:hypothetical protein
MIHARFKRGDLVRMIDSDGNLGSVMIYMGIHPPGTLPDDTGLELPRLYSCWHYSIIDTSGQIKHLEAAAWTPIPVDA